MKLTRGGLIVDGHKGTGTISQALDGEKRRQVILLDADELRWLQTVALPVLLSEPEPEAEPPEQIPGQLAIDA